MSTLTERLPRRLRCSSPWQARPDLGSLVRRPGVVLCLILGAALAVRIGWVLHTPGFVPLHDAHDFDRYGVSLARHGRLPVITHGVQHGPLAYRPPGYPFFLAGVYKLFGLTSRVVAARIVQAFLGTIAVGLIGAIGWLLWTPAAGLVAAAIAAVYPPLVFVSESMYAETLFLPVSLAAVACALAFGRARRPLPWAVAVGVLCGAGVLVRPNSAVLLVPVLLLMWGARRRRRSWRALTHPAVALACAVLVVAPWTVRNARVLHHFVPVTTELGNTLAGTYNDETRLDRARPAAWTEPRLTREYGGYYLRPGLNDATLDTTLRAAALRYIGAHPGYLWEVWRWNSARMLGLTGFAEAHIGGDSIGIGPRAADLGAVAFWVLALVALAGIFTTAVRRAPRALWLAPLLFYASVVMLNGEPPRFRIAMDPYFILLAAAALCAAAPPAWERLRNANRRRVATPAV